MITFYETIKIKTKTNFKKFFVAPDDDGQWRTKILQNPYDWRGSIQYEKWVRKIALESRQIAEEEGCSVSIMWFVGIPKEVCPVRVLPWYHEPYDPKILNPSLTKRTKKTYEKSFVIKKRSDLELLKTEALNEFSSIRRIEIQPEEDELLRDKNTLRDIGKLSNKIGSIIMLEGGVLSHAYYQLMQTKAIVEVLHPFGDIEEKREFNKIVRDKVPKNIENGGEIVMKTYVSGDILLRLLKEKLIEEAFEVLDSIDQDSIVGELADVSEVIDGILSHLDLNRAALRKIQTKKRQKAGSFKDGVALIETKNPLPSIEAKNSDLLFRDIKLGDAFSIDPQEIIELSHKIEKWSDQRKSRGLSERILQVEVPMVKDKWSAISGEIIIDSESIRNTVKAKITGSRVGAKINIRLSLFTPQKQLDLFTTS